ncbi:hypothetical protein ACXR2U_13140 [Jatrophihabitans sp. YIM 134969]
MTWHRPAGDKLLGHLKANSTGGWSSAGGQPISTPATAPVGPFRGAITGETSGRVLQWAGEVTAPTAELFTSPFGVGGDQLELVVTGFGRRTSDPIDVTIDGVLQDFRPVSNLNPLTAYLSVPALLLPGQHRYQLTQHSTPTRTAGFDYTIVTPTLRVRGGPQGSAVRLQALLADFPGDDRVTVALTDATGRVFTTPERDPQTADALFTASPVAPGPARLTATSAANGVTVAVPLQIWPATARSASTLSTGQSLVSAQGRYALTLQSDGNLVLRGPYDSVPATGITPPAVWNSRTGGHPGAKLSVQTDGNVVLRDRGGKALWVTNTVGAGAVALAVTDQPNLTLRTSTGRLVWKAR